MTTDIAVIVAVIAPLMAIASASYRLGAKLNGLHSCIEKMRGELDRVSTENMKLSAEVRALRDLLTALVKK